MAYHKTLNLTQGSEIFVMKRLPSNIIVSQIPNRIATVAWGMIETKDLFSSNFLNYRPTGSAYKSNFALSPDRKWLAWTAAGATYTTIATGTSILNLETGVINYYATYRPGESILFSSDSKYLLFNGPYSGGGIKRIRLSDMTALSTNINISGTFPSNLPSIFGDNMSIDTYGSNLVLDTIRKSILSVNYEDASASWVYNGTSSGAVPLPGGSPRVIGESSKYMWLIGNKTNEKSFYLHVFEKATYTMRSIIVSTPDYILQGTIMPALVADDKILMLRVELSDGSMKTQVFDITGTSLLSTIAVSNPSYVFEQIANSSLQFSTLRDYVYHAASGCIFAKVRDINSDKNWRGLYYLDVAAHTPGGVFDFKPVPGDFSNVECFAVNLGGMKIVSGTVVDNANNPVDCDVFVLDAKTLIKIGAGRSVGGVFSIKFMADLYQEVLVLAEGDHKVDVESRVMPCATTVS